MYLWVQMCESLKIFAKQNWRSQNKIGKKKKEVYSQRLISCAPIPADTCHLVLVSKVNLQENVHEKSELDTVATSTLLRRKCSPHCPQITGCFYRLV